MTTRCILALHNETGAPISAEDIAGICYEANRAYCETLGDFSFAPLALAPDWQIDTNTKGVQAILDGTVRTPEESHHSWMLEKVANGWVYGPEKDPEAKTHPCMLPYDELPIEMRMKDHIFRAIVFALTKEQVS